MYILILKCPLLLHNISLPIPLSLFLYLLPPKFPLTLLACYYCCYLLPRSLPLSILLFLFKIFLLHLYTYDLYIIPFLLSLLLNADLTNLFIEHSYICNYLFENIYIYTGCDYVTDNNLPCSHHHK